MPPVARSASTSLVVAQRTSAGRTGGTSPHLGRSGTNRLAGALRYAAPALAVYLSLRAVGLLLLYVWAEAVDRDVIDLLGRSDSQWYVGIAEHGYDTGLTDRENPLQSNLNFFPLFPTLVRVLAAISPVDAMTTALLVSGAASLAAAWGLFAVGSHLHDRRTGVLLAALWGALPHAVVQSMAYTEGLFTALAAWTMYAMFRGHWLLPGGLCLLAGLTRPTAPVLIAVVCCAALLAIVRRQDSWRPWAAFALAPLGYLGYLAWVGQRVGRLDGWFHIQHAGWNYSWDGGAGTVRAVTKALSRESAFDPYLVSAVLAVALVLFVIAILDRQPWQLLLYVGLLLLLTFGSAGYYHARARYLVPAFALLIPVAVGLARTRTGRAVTVVAALALISAYTGGYLLVVWKYSP